VSGYRDDLDAAAARIAQLEAEVAELRRRLARSPAAQERIAALRARRDVAVEALRSAEWRAKRNVGLAVVFALGGVLAFVLSIASLGSSGHPVNAAILGFSLSVPLVAFTAWWGAWRKLPHVKTVAALERELADAMASADDIRVADAVRVALDDEASEPEPEAELEERRR